MNRIYHGWYVVVVAFLSSMLVIGITFSAFGLFVKPVSAEFHLSRANMNTALIILNVGNMVTAPFVGRALDRFPAKYVMMLSAALFGGSLIALSFSKSLWLSAALIALPLSIAFNAIGTLGMSVFIARWFVVRRGRAMAVSSLGVKFGHIAIAPIMGFLILAHGWRTALLVAGAAAGSLLLVLGAAVRDRPGPDDIESQQIDGATSGPSKATGVARAKIMDILRMPQFWLITFSVKSALAIVQATIISLVPMALERGLTTLQATSLVSVWGGTALVGGLLLATIADKINRILLLASLFGLGAVMDVLLLSSGDSYPFLLGCAVLVGLLNSMLSPTFYALAADQFGSASFGTVRGIMTPFGSVLAILAVRLAGESFDRTGSYNLLFSVFIPVQLVAMCMMLALRLISRPKPGSEAVGVAS